MFASMKHPGAVCAALATALLLSGCGNLSKVTDDGTTASPVWPEMTDETMTWRDGIHPAPQALAQVKAGMKKDHLYQLLGRPHFLEGFMFVREWDYLFHLQGPSGDMACQYKVLFDRDMRAQQFLWREPACEAAAKALMKTSA
jgi:outer membrane protein assembly factor BamE (lipoprotein component of BamABCDE complex)